MESLLPDILAEIALFFVLPFSFVFGYPWLLAVGAAIFCAVKFLLRRDAKRAAIAAILAVFAATYAFYKICNPQIPETPAILREIPTFLFLPLLFIARVPLISLGVFAIIFGVVKLLTRSRVKYALIIAIIFVDIMTYSVFKICNPTGASSHAECLIAEKIVPSLRPKFQDMPKMDADKLRGDCDFSECYKKYFDKKMEATGGAFWYETGSYSNLTITLYIYSLEETTLSDADIKKIKDFWREITPYNSDSFTATFFKGFVNVWRIKPPYANNPFLRISLKKGYPASCQKRGGRGECAAQEPEAYFEKWLW